MVTSDPQLGIMGSATTCSMRISTRTRASFRKGAPLPPAVNSATPAPDVKPDASAAAASVTEAGKLQFGDYELSSDDIAMLMQRIAADDFAKLRYRRRSLSGKIAGRVQAA